MNPRNFGTPGLPNAESDENERLTRRIERLSKATPPAPKGRGIVLALIGLAVIWAGIETFTGGSGAARSVRENHAHDEPAPVVASRQAPDAPGQQPEDPVAPGIAPGEVIDIHVPRTVDAEPFELPEGIPAATALEIRSSITTLRQALRPVESKNEAKLRKAGVEYALHTLPAHLQDVPEAHRDLTRKAILEEYVTLLGSPRYRAALLRSATWLAEGFGDEGQEPVLEIYLIAHQKALADDAAVPAALMFLSAVPGPIQGRALNSLDTVIADEDRPLEVRVLAALYRPAVKPGSKLDELANAPSTHPSLRRALLDANDK